MKMSFQKIATAIGSSAFLTASGLSYALPFNIFPAAPLPTQILPGQTVTALYTVQNNTASTRNGNFVKYLPLNVTQITSDPSISNLCGATFNLTKRGTPGDSCTLELLIRGIVNSSDPDPHHHLFVCFPGGANCAGTQFPLNVTIQTQQQFAYIADDAKGNFITICPINANQSFGACFTQTNSSFKFPVDIVVNSTANRAYVLNAGDSTIESCAINANGTLENCVETASPQFVSSPGGLRLSPNNMFLYLSGNFHPGANQLSKCVINPDLTVGTCTLTPTAPPFFDSPAGRITFNPSGTFAYIANQVTMSVTSCQVNPATGDLFACIDNVVSGSFFPAGIDVDTAGTFAYVPVSDLASISQVLGCPIIGGIVSSSCTTSNSPLFNFTSGTSSLFLSNKQVAYLPNFLSDTVTGCVASSGVLSNCVNTGNDFVTPVSAWLAKGK